MPSGLRASLISRSAGSRPSAGISPSTATSNARSKVFFSRAPSPAGARTVRMLATPAPAAPSGRKTLRADRIRPMEPAYQSISIVTIVFHFSVARLHSRGHWAHDEKGGSLSLDRTRIDRLDANRIRNRSTWLTRIDPGTFGIHTAHGAHPPADSQFPTESP